MEKSRYGNKLTAVASKEHARTWRSCDACPLCETRSRVVLWRGEIPAEVVFVGVAPGLSENALGVPFTGAEGQCIDQVIATAWEEGWKNETTARFRYALTNLVACLPKTNGKERNPTKKEIASCSHRLNQFLDIANPKLVVLLGKVAVQGFHNPSYPTLALAHPAEIIRAEGAEKTLRYTRAIVTLRTALTKLAEGYKR